MGELKLEAIHNMDEAVRFTISGTAEATEEILKIFGIAYDPKWQVYKKHEDCGCPNFGNKRNYGEILKHATGGEESSDNFTMLISYHPKSITVVLLKTKNWKQYRREDN